jgi:hypothetical protein
MGWSGTPEWSRMIEDKMAQQKFSLRDQKLEPLFVLWLVSDSTPKIG